MTKIQVLQAVAKSGISKAGKPYSFQICKAVVTMDNGDVDVGEVVLFDQAAPIQPGHYAPIFSVRRSHEGKLEGAITGLQPLNVKAAA